MTQLRKRPAPVTISGKGTRVTKKFKLDGDVTLFKMTHEGESNFAVTLLNEKGEYVELVVNEIGAYKGTRAYGEFEKGMHLFNVEASGSWTIAIEQPVPTQASKPPLEFSGEGPGATGFFQTNGGLIVFRVSHKGRNNFIVTLLNYHGEAVDLLVNEIGRFTGSHATSSIEGATYLLDIDASGKWSIKVK